MRGVAQINQTELCAGLAEFTSTGSQARFSTGWALVLAGAACHLPRRGLQILVISMGHFGHILENQAIWVISIILVGPGPV